MIGKCVTWDEVRIAPPPEHAATSRAGCAETGPNSFILCLPRRVIRATRIHYDRQVMFGLSHLLSMRSGPELHVLKPWLNSLFFAYAGPCSGDSDVYVGEGAWCSLVPLDPALLRTDHSLLSL
jgi:hypothetical protein